MDTNDMLYFNGVNGATGGYGLPPMTASALSKIILDEPEPQNLDELRNKNSQKEPHLGAKEGVDPKDLGQTGWGIIFAREADPALKEALADLIKLRQTQAGEHFRLYEGDGGVDANESALDFLVKHGAGPGPANPDQVPYYLLIVGDPADISFEFQYELDVQYAVGRICFDTLDEYERYAQSVVRAEKGDVKLSRQLAFFSVANPDDPATHLSNQFLMQPLYNHFKEKKPDWEVNLFTGDMAQKAQLARLLGGDQTPALLFTASHGMEFPLNHPLQLPHQGALLCQDWAGPRVWPGPVPQDFYFAGDDLDSSARLLGLIAFCFACYGAGTPLLNDFSKERQTIAPRPFIASLPAKMLSHPQGGALAAIAHVERAWGCSFGWRGAGPQTTVFESTLLRLLEGHPVGSAVEFFNVRHAEISTILLSEQKKRVEFQSKPGFSKLAYLWTANNDARSYVILGDPAVRLPIAEANGTAVERPTIEVVGSHLAGIQPVSSSQQTGATEVEQHEAPSPQLSAFRQGDPELEFGMRSTAADITASIREVAGKLGEVLRNAADDLSSLEVMTYTSSDLSKVTYDPRTRSFSGDARLRAMTRIALDGDQVNLIPERKHASLFGDEDKSEVEIDEQLWTIHREMVGLAQNNRIQFFKALADVVASLIRV